ncbi:spinster family MFS transporter [Mesorhizobium erdmanii]|uniref:spinster family MFS transporter n=1 Tax=Mesorhizobium erdmanii TaxID=1777866 RepID=UPI000400414B|nr:MFS transporter [Mesorhizobium erdmanii]
MRSSIDISAEVPARTGYMVVVLAAAYTFSFMDRQILGLMIGPIRQDLGISDVEVSLLQGLAFALLFGLGSLPAGRLADRGNRSVLIAIGICFWSLMTVACGFARSFGGLFIARAGVGIGESVLSPAAYSMLADAYSPRDLPRAMAGFMMGGIVGAGLGFVVGGLVVSYVSQGTTLYLPILGELKSWQAVFVLIGLPGLMVSALALTLREPTRRGLLKDVRDGRVSSLSTGGVLRHVMGRWQGYVPLTLGAAALSVLGYGYLGWFPTYLIRDHGVSPGSAGVVLGVEYLCVGPLGALGGVRFARYMQGRGYVDGNLRAVAIMASAFVPLSLGTLASNATVAFIAAAPVIFLLSAYIGVVAASLQLVTPNQMRALVSALFQMTINVLGLSIGPTIVAATTQHVFQNDLAVGKSLVISVAGAGLISTCLLTLALPAYRRMLAESSSWSSSK